MTTPNYETVQIPIPNDLPWFFITITLSEIIYTLHFRYNTRMDRWIMDLNDATDTPIISGIPLLIGRNLLGRFTIPNLPGTFFVTDDTGQGTQPTRYSFGITHTLYYADPTGTT